MTTLSSNWKKACFRDLGLDTVNKTDKIIDENICLSCFPILGVYFQHLIWSENLQYFSWGDITQEHWGRHDWQFIVIVMLSKTWKSLLCWVTGGQERPHPLLRKSKCCVTFDVDALLNLHRDVPVL